MDPDLARTLLNISAEIGREIGILLNRRGDVEYVIVGEKRRIRIPEIERERDKKIILNGLRFIHTHLNGEILSKEDLTTLALGKFDLVGCVTRKRGGEKEFFHGGYLIPDEGTGGMWEFIGPIPIDEIRIDFLEFIKELEDEFVRKRGIYHPVKKGAETCVIVCVVPPRSRKDVEESVSEMMSLCESVGLSVLDTIVQKPKTIHPGYVVGKGKMEEILIRSASSGCDVIVFDRELTPAQLRNISDLTDLKVIDRNQLILDIFATKAKTKEAKVQVELAQLKYIFPRLAEKNTAFSKLTGGIGGRGPGETKLEIDKRRIRERIALLEERLEEIKRIRDTKREKRKQSFLPVVSIVGYANSGKSSLLNLLTKSDVEVDARPFSTLSPTTRLIKYPHRKNIILSDTVGLIRDLPETLFDAFRSTFEEISYSDLLLLLVDVSDYDIEAKIRSVEEVLKKLGLENKKKIIVFNKIDKLNEEEKLLLKNLERRYDAVSISCTEKIGIERLVERIEEELKQIPI